VDRDLRLENFAILGSMAKTKWLNLKDIAIDESDDGLDPNWLLLPYETPLQRNFEAIQHGLRLEEAVKKNLYLKK
jgi:hypothetical protein